MHCVQQQWKATPGYCTSTVQHHSPHSSLLHELTLLLHLASALWIASNFVQQPAQAKLRAALHGLNKPTVCETLRCQLYQVLSRCQLYQVLSSDKTQRPWLQTNSWSEHFLSSQTCARIFLEWGKGPLHLRLVWELSPVTSRATLMLVHSRAEQTGEAAGSSQCYSRLHPLRTPKCNQEKLKDGIYVLNSAADKLDEG